MNNRQIEAKAVNAIEDYFATSKLVATYLSANDKEPLWDGHLYLYKDKSHTNENLLARIPTQIKGKESETLESQTTYNIKVACLRNYLRDGGILFFVVKMLPDASRTKIFYKELAPLLIKRILSGHKKQKTISVLMDALGDDVGETETRLIDFYNDCKRQTSSANKPVLSYDTLRKEGFKAITFSRTVKNGDDFFQSLRTKPIYIYAQSPSGVEYPIGEDKFFVSISPSPKTFTEDVYIGKKKYFTSYRVSYKASSRIYEFDDTLKIEVTKATDSERFNVEFNVRARNQTLQERIAQTRMFLDILESSSIRIGKLLLPITNTKANKEEVEGWLNRLQEWDNVLKDLGVHKDLDFSYFMQDDERMLNLLVGVIERGELYCAQKASPKCSFKAGNIKICLYAKGVSKGKYKLSNLFDSNIEVKYKRNKNDKPKPTSVFSILRKEDFIQFDNIPYDKQVASYKTIAAVNEEIYEHANFDLLEMLSAIDEMAKSQDYKYELTLKAAKDLSEWLLNECPHMQTMPHEMLVINHLQVVRRMRVLHSEEKLQLIEITQDPQVGAVLKAGAYLVMGNTDMFDYLFAKLSSEEQKQLTDFPIYHLYQPQS